jgi:two-component system phosphate regulon sensor histidine kinase PhoR
LTDETRIQPLTKPGQIGPFEEGAANISGAHHAYARLLARKWLVVVVGLLMAAFVVFAALPWYLGGIGFLAFAAAAALVPGDALFRPSVEASRDPVAEEVVTDSRLHHILEVIPDPAILLDSGGAILHYNARASQQYPGIRRGGNVSAIIRQPDFLDGVAAVQLDGEPVAVDYSERVPVERRISATIAYLPESGAGEMDQPAVLACLRDLTEQERVNQMRTDFIANASHELRTPLSSLLGFIETLQGPASKDVGAQKKFLAIMAKQAERMKRLIDDLLSLSRLEMKAHLLPSAQVDLNEALRYVVDLMEPLAKESGARLKLEEKSKSVQVIGDRDEIVQLFQNLVHNAIKYGGEGGTVRIRLEPEGGPDADQDRVAVSVIDKGAGIAPEHVPRLTERFYRVDVASSRDKGSTGLGLAIVKHVVNRHRGELQILSEPGKGSTFKVLLTRVSGEIPKSAREDAEAALT